MLSRLQAKDGSKPLMAKLRTSSDTTSQWALVRVMGAREKGGQAWTTCMGNGKQDTMEAPQNR